MTDFAKKSTELSKLIKSWGLIQVNSRNEFELLAKKILNNLSEGQPVIKVKRIIESELCVTYGLYSNEFDADKLANEIMDWWNE